MRVGRGTRLAARLWTLILIAGCTSTVPDATTPAFNSTPVFGQADARGVRGSAPRKGAGVNPRMINMKTTRVRAQGRPGSAQLYAPKPVRMGLGPGTDGILLAQPGKALDLTGGKFNKATRRSGKKIYLATRGEPLNLTGGKLVPASVVTGAKQGASRRAARYDPSRQTGSGGSLAAFARAKRRASAAKSQTIDRDNSKRRGAAAATHVREGDPALSRRARRVVARIQTRPVAAIVLKLADPIPGVRLKGIQAAAQINWSEQAPRDRRAVGVLLAEIVNREDLFTAERAAGALARVGGREAVAALLRALDASWVRIRVAAVRGLGTLRARRAVGPLVSLLERQALQLRRLPGQRRDADTQQTPSGLPDRLGPSAHLVVRAEAARALGAIGHRGATKPLLRCMRRTDEVDVVRVACAEALARMGREEDRAGLAGWRFIESAARLTARPARSAARFARSGGRVSALQALGRLGTLKRHTAKAVRALAAGLESGNKEVWATALQSLAALGTGPIAPTLRRQMRAGDRALRARAAIALALAGAPDAVELAAEILGKRARTEPVWRSPAPTLRAHAAALLGHLGDRKATPHLIGALEDSSRSVRQAAAEALGRLGDPAARKALAQMASDPDPILRGTAVAALANLSGKRELLRGSRAELRRFARRTRVAQIKRYGVQSFVTTGETPAVVLSAPDGARQLYRIGDEVAGGFRITEINPPANPGQAKGRVRLVHADEDSLVVVLQAGKH